ncbi:zinc ABC transporter substrate-binding protein [Jannaschia pohangensis]|uniref:High-affinity zinc uptake system protein ZnuA n=1 Tax=Jannaschia pohangensis TaxID=390807 RepID=A0A1I3IW55_9RHOB|nr:zinc ABC transporter substrate-binding protein [Jannaschia pohangensis]SFI52186.1 zinc transport system substrate-binding protein [Jannaschia pohangensis]
MSRILLSLSINAALMGGAAFAEVPRVAVDIAPIHSLVARVMDGVGTPDLIVQSGASPHEYSLRPSEATALQKADIVFWIGPDLTPWLDDAIETLATDASVTELLEADGTIELEFREGALFEAHDEHGQDEHEEGAHEDHAGGEHAEEKAGHEDHDHGEHDPHAWLSPQNASTWLNVIASQLSVADPENAGAYFANAAAGRAEIDALTADVNAVLDPLRGARFIVFHDAYQYFEAAFDFPAAGAISISDASDPGPARIAEIRARIADEGIDCVLAEPQFNAGLVATVLDGTEAGTGILDPLGSDLEPGPALYPQLIRNLATNLAECL